MKFLRTSLIALSIVWAPLGFTGEGHDHSMPGTLPAPTHGGRLGEAKKVGAESHKPESEHGYEHKGEKPHEHGKEEASKSHSEEVELFIEAKLSGEELALYALELREGAKVFETLVPSENLKVSELKVEFFRPKRTEAVAVATNKDNWTAKIPKNKEPRMFAHVTVIKGSEQRVAKIQIEKHR